MGMFSREEGTNGKQQWQWQASLGNCGIPEGGKNQAMGRPGVKSSIDLKNCMSDVIADLSGDRIETRRASAIVGAGRTLLQTVLAEHRFGYPTRTGQTQRPRTLSLTA